MSIEAIRELETLASVCPELNMANYTEDDVRHLNDWAIEMSLLVERYVLSQQPDNAACKSVQKRLAAQQPTQATQATPSIPSDGPSTYAQRFTAAVAVICGVTPPVALVCDWINKEERHDDLQQWVGSYAPGWVQSIAVLDAAHQMADQPTEGGNHEPAQQPATPAPVASRNPFASRCYAMSESHLSGHRLIVGFEKLGDAQDAHEWVVRQGRGDFTHPAPSAPVTTEPVEDGIRNAEDELNCAEEVLDAITCEFSDGEFPVTDFNCIGDYITAVVDVFKERLAAQQPATPEPGAWSERELLRHAQAAVVMPMIGPLLDAWENSDREVMSQEPELSKQLKNINSAMEDADTRPAPSVPNLIEKAISSGCFGVLPVKATIPMCKAGWGASGGELTFQQIGHIYEEMYKARPLPDDAIYAAPSVPDDVVRDAERGRFLVGWLKRYGLLQAEFGQMGVGEKPENWWLLHAPWGIDQTRPFLGHGKTPEQAIDAAKDAT